MRCRNFEQFPLFSKAVHLLFRRINFYNRPINSHLRFYACVLIVLIVNVPLLAFDSQLPSCSNRPTALGIPKVDLGKWCVERVISDARAGELGFTSLAVSDDGTLYAARPLTGQVLALVDTNGDLLPDTAHVVAEGLTLPNGLAYANGALYISGGTHLYRLAGTTLTTLVDDLPAGGGLWTGGLAVGEDQRIYVATGASCDFCKPGDPARGAILSFALDGTDRQLVATGLRQPADVAFRDGVLWTVDTARDDLSSPADLDELNRVTRGANFGAPDCIGKDNQPDPLVPTATCTGMTAPALSLPTHSTPLGLARYTSDTFPSLKGTLLVVLGGSHNAYELAGYRLIAVHFDDSGQPTGFENIVPSNAIFKGLSVQDVNYQGYGLWPHRPFDVAVSPEGWIYWSMGGGSILALRPL